MSLPSAVQTKALRDPSVSFSLRQSALRGEVAGDRRGADGIAGGRTGGCSGRSWCGITHTSGNGSATGIIALTVSGIPTNFRLAFPIPLVYILDKAFPIIEGIWFLYERERVLDAIWERVLKPMTECTITPIDLAGQRVKLDEEISELLIGPHAEAVEVRFCRSFRIRVSEHITQFLGKTCPVM
jgi:hypothetical protein